MKNLFFLIGLISTSLFAGEITYFQGTWRESLDKCKKENKLLMLDCYTDWCSWCKVMDRTTFKSDTTLEILNKTFVCVRREMEKEEEGRILGMKYQVSGYPTFLFFNGDGKLVYISVGYRPTVDFVNELKSALDPAKQLNLTGYSDNLTPNYPMFYVKAFGTGKERVWPKTDTVVAYLDKQKDLMKEVNWAVMSKFSLNARYNDWIIEHAADLRTSYGKSNVDDKILNIIYGQVDSAAKHNDRDMLNRALKNLDTYFPESEYALTRLAWELSFEERNNEWKEAAILMGAMLDTIPNARLGNVAEFINSQCWNFYTKCVDPGAIEMTLPMMARVTDIAPDYPKMDTYAALLFKAGEYKDAKRIAEKAIEMGKANKENVEETEALLKKINEKLQ